ncbi:MAG: GAF domain-containing protein [Pseudomonadota bacterium]
MNAAQRLGDYIDRSPAEIDSALASVKDQSSSRRIGERLLDAKFISADELFRSIQAQRLDRLRACKLFSGLPFPDLCMLCDQFEEISLDRDTQFITEGKPEPYLYVLASGRLEVFITHPERGNVVLATIEPGEPIGEMGYFSSSPRSASVRTMNNCELLRIPYERLGQCFSQSSALLHACMDVASDRLRKSNKLNLDQQYELESARRSLQHLTEFLDFSEAAKLGDGIEDLIGRLVHTASNIIDAERASLFLIDRDTGDLWSKVAEGERRKEIRVPAGQGVIGWVAEHEDTLVIDDAYQDARFNPEVDKKTGYKTRSILCSPIWSLKNEVLGVVQVINKCNGNSFNADDRALLRAFAHQAAVAVENFNLYEKMMLGYRRVAVMLDISTAINRKLDFPDLIQEIVANTALILQCDRSSFFVLDEKAGELWSMEGQGVDSREIRVPITKGLAGAVASTGETLNIADAYEDERFNPEFDRRLGYRTRSVLCVPVCTREGKVSGVIQAINKDQGDFNDEDIDLLGAIAAQISIALENAKLHAETLNAKNYLHSVQESISNSIVTLDPDYQIVTANRAAQRLFPPVAEDDGERDIRTLLNTRNAHWLSMIDKVYEFRGGVGEFDVDFKMPDGQTATTNVNIVPHLDDEDEFQGVVMVVEDVTGEKRIKSAFSHYLAPAVIDQLLDSPGGVSLGGESREMTFLFTDVADFTRMTESLDSSLIVDLLNEYFDVTGAVVLRHGGTIDKIVGDALHVMFNAPLDQNDHAQRAVECALELHTVTESFREKMLERDIDFGATRIGVNTGAALVGNFGGSARFDYTAHGDAINTAARLEGANKHLGTTICVADTTVEQCSDIVFRPIGEIVLKGKSESVTAFEPLLEDSSLSHALDRYLSAYERLVCGSTSATDAFVSLLGQCPDDKLAAFHLERCLAGSIGSRISLSHK